MRLDRGNKRARSLRGQRGITGLETAIVLIAFVVVKNSVVQSSPPHAMFTGLPGAVRMVPMCSPSGLMTQIPPGPVQ